MIHPSVILVKIIIEFDDPTSPTGVTESGVGVKFRHPDEEYTEEQKDKLWELLISTATRRISYPIFLPGDNNSEVNTLRRDQ